MIKPLTNLWARGRDRPVINRLAKLLASRQRPAASKSAAPKFLDDDFPAVVPQSRAKGEVRVDQSLLGNDAISCWMANLEESIRPVELPISFKRITLYLALHWSDTELLHGYLQGLIFDPRTDRQGFPRAVMTELLRLQGSVMNRMDEARLFTGQAHGKR